MNKNLDIQIIPASIKDYPIVQNMARFYVYDMSRNCGANSKDWACPEDGLYESFDFKGYFEDVTRKAFIIKVKGELAGFVLLNKKGVLPETEWKMGEFFILARFQAKGIGEKVAQKIWEIHPGLWEISVIPENKPALSFWRKAISYFTSGKYKEEIKIVDHDEDQPQRYILSFNSRVIIEKSEISIRKATLSDINYMVNLSYQKRRDYEKAQPQFWKYKEGAEETQREWFQELLSKDDYILLVAESDEQVTGFVIGRIVTAPDVYNPGGLTLMIDDFCVQAPYRWEEVGGQLIGKLKIQAKIKGAAQILVVSGAHDIFKRDFLRKYGLTIASEWFVGGI